MSSAQPSKNTPPLSDISADELQLELGLLKKKMRILENDKVVLENDKVVLENSNKNSQSQLTLATLSNRDYAIGLSAELAEFKARDQIAARDLLLATDALRIEMTKGYETGESLVAEMTKGYETGKTLVAEMARAHAAETLVLKLQAEVAHIQRLQNELDALRQSRAFKIGHTITAPIRILRRIFS